MVNKNSKRRADRRVVRTGGTVFPDGTILEPIATAGNSERLRLAMWSGTRTRVGSDFEHGGQLYEPAALDPTILKALFLPTHVAPAEPARQLLGDMAKVLVTYTGIADRCVIFESTNTARRRLSLGATRGLPLVVKHVKPIKVGGSWLTNEFVPNECFVPEAQPEVCAADAPVLRESDSRVRRELGSFDLTSRGFDQLAKLLTLLFRDPSRHGPGDRRGDFFASDGRKPRIGPGAKRTDLSGCTQ